MPLPCSVDRSLMPEEIASVARVPRAATPSGDRRKAERYLLTGAVELDGTPAIVRNVSRTGAYFETGKPLILESRLAFTLDLPDIDGKDSVRFACLGRICRVAPLGGNGWGVAVAFLDFGFELAFRP